MMVKFVFRGTGGELMTEKVNSCDRVDSFSQLCSPTFVIASGNSQHAEIDFPRECVFLFLLDLRFHISGVRISTC